LVAYNPHTTGFGFAWNNLAVLILWGIGGFIVAMRRFTWVPRGR
jgi:ABC-2 type transport system permease protein